MRRITGLAALKRAIGGATTTPSGAAQYRLLPAALYNTCSHSNPHWFSQKLAYQFGPLIPSLSRITGSRRCFSVSAASLAEEQDARINEPRRSDMFLPKDVVLYQYEACPFCNKIRAFLDYYKIPYNLEEVNPISKKEIKWSEYKKVPILMVDGEQMIESSDIIDKLYGRVHPENNVRNDDEERKWRGWVDDHLVHILAPNLYRNPTEAIEAFAYITTHGNFSFTERILAKYAGAAAMYFVSKKLKKKHNIVDEREALYKAADTWVDVIRGRQFHGGQDPNLADLAVFGVLRPIRYLQSGRDMVSHNQKIGEWYAHMESAVGSSSIKA